MDANGGNITKIAAVADDTSPSWSPDGTRIAFSSFALDGKSSLIYTVRPDGTQLTALTTSGYSTDPSWSSDSQKLTFSSYTGGSSGYRVAVLGANDVGGTPVIIGKSVFLQAQNPVFNSDDSGIIFAGDSDLFSIDLDGTNLTQLTNNPGFDGTPSVTAVAAALPLQANDDFYTYNANPRNRSTRQGMLIVSAPGVLANDQVDFSQSTRVVLVNKPTAKGVSLSLRPNGSFTFTTTKKGAQTFTFTYRIINGNMTSNVTTVTISAATS